MEAKKSKKAAIENQRGSWLLMGLVVALAFMFVSFEWTQHDVRVAAVSSDDESIFVTELIPITFPEEKLEPPPPPEIKQSEWIEIVDDTEEVTDNVSVVPDNVNEPYKVVWIPPVVETEEVVEDVIHVSVEVMPEFPGGMDKLLQFINDNMQYPTKAQTEGIQGRVIVQFIIDEDGYIIEPNIVRSVESSLDNEALRLIKMLPQWKPGTLKGKAVKVKYTVPVAFKLK